MNLLQEDKKLRREKDMRIKKKKMLAAKMKKEKEARIAKMHENVEKATNFRQFWLKQWIFGTLKTEWVRKCNRITMADKMYQNKLRLTALKVWNFELQQKKKIDKMKELVMFESFHKRQKHLKVSLVWDVLCKIRVRE